SRAGSNPDLQGLSSQVSGLSKRCHHGIGRTPEHCHYSKCRTEPSQRAVTGGMPMSDCSGSPEVIFQRVGARAWVHLDIAFGAEADDHLSRTLREGWFPTSPATDLLFQMVRPGDRVLDLGANI